MRIVSQVYEGGALYIYETDERGTHIRDMEGTAQPGKRIQATVEMQWDDNDDGRDALLTAVARGSKLISP